ncbi:RelA/SpoT domain-containing protein [Aquincola sp. J276]|uniref:RelA/SpoT domain-containing protein n=1 Tax=Aquincola sp. J276 TaxID=2898432 RepID=UPI002151E03B|nr:RelA/SpoT domain-containing protein [Aquincola sp. J276]MCR5867209.1 RelA/SpoT domain-containing protein [Aquincola sp. J276]
MQDAALTDAALRAFDEMNHELRIFMSNVRTWFETHPTLIAGNTPLVHSVKSRLKDREHLRAKIEKKSRPDNLIDGSNLGQRVTDLAGVRVLHLHQEQLTHIHAEIERKIAHRGDWVLHEPPRAYTWDPERKSFYEAIGFQVHLKPSSYTSVHYTVRPRQDSPLCCEIQVRTLFEEIWGEVDHALNYPDATDSVACREQLLVLGKVVGAGSRLVDSIYRTVAAEPSPIVQPEQPSVAPAESVRTVVYAPVVPAVSSGINTGRDAETIHSDVAPPANGVANQTQPAGLMGNESHQGSGS